MPCANCGSILEPVDVDEAKDSGEFTEEWRCVQCDAREFIHGKEQEPPKNWDHWGSAA